MPRYLIWRRFEVGSDEMPRIGSKSRTIIRDQFPDVVWEHSHVAVDDEGHVYTACIYEAPNEDTLRAHSKALGQHEVEWIYEIAGDVTPSDFPYVEQPS